MTLLEVPSHLAKLAFNELGETPERRCAALQDLRQRIEQLPQEKRLEDTSDECLVRFLRSRKYDIDAALKQTVKLQKFNNDHPEWTENLCAEEFKDLESGYQMLSHRGPKGEHILCLRTNNIIKVFTPEFRKRNPLAMVRSNIWLLETLSRDPEVQVAGMIFCNSLKGLTFSDNLTLSKILTVSEMTATFKYMSIMGVRMTGAFVFDQPAYLTWLWSVVRMCISDKIRSRLHLCGSDFARIKPLLPNEDPSILPACMGGSLQDGSYGFIDACIAKEKSARSPLEHGG